MKYVVWGCGFYGNWMTEILGGSKRIVSIVDRNPELQGTTLCGVPVISYDEYLSGFSEYPVIVSPRYYEDEIVEQLNRKDIFWAFPLSKEMASIESLFVQLPLNQTLEKYRNVQKLAIYGASILAFLLYELFAENGFKVGLVIPQGTQPLLEKYIKEHLQIKTVPVDNIKKENILLLLAVELEAGDESELSETICDKYYDLQLHEELFYNPELEQFKNIHEGKRCFIVGTGPSLKMEDLDILYKNKEVSISVNGIFNAFERTKWRPTYFVLSAPEVKVWKDIILNMDVSTKFVSDIAWYFDDKTARNSNVYKWHVIWRFFGKNLFPKFSNNPSCKIYTGGTVVYECLQLAAYMGFKEIYLLGTDCTLAPDGKTLHFIEDESTDRGRLNLKEIMLAYQAAKQYADAHGIKIYNATRGGALEVFPRVDFDSLFDQ